MLRFKLMLLTAVPLLGVQPLMAGTFAVGSCKAKVPSFASISVAVSAVPPGSTILVCPGTYSEQVIITQALTLVGITDSNQDLAVITVPSTGLVANSTSIFGETIAAQLLVQGAGPVNISDIAVDGTGGDLQCAGNTWVAGMFYAAGSSGQVNHAKCPRYGWLRDFCGQRGCPAESFCQHSRQCRVGRSNRTDRHRNG